MSVQWRTAPKAHSGPSFIRVVPKKIVCILCERTEYAVLAVHWDEASKGSFPCLVPDACPLCPGRSWLTSYAPALVWASSSQRWVQGILPLGDPTGGLATMDVKGMPIIVGKEGNGEARGRTIYHGSNQDNKIPPPPPTNSFDVRPFLLRRWGLYKEADLVGCELHLPEPTLPFPEAQGA